jgi:hypothetical protein
MTVDPESDLASATLAQLLLQEGRAPEALEYFDKAVELGRTEQELISALSYAEVPPSTLLTYLDTNVSGNPSAIRRNHQIPSPRRKTTKTSSITANRIHGLTAMLTHR